MSAEDKAIGWSAYTLPGKRGNIQKNEKLAAQIISITKARLALRCLCQLFTHSKSNSNGEMWVDRFRLCLSKTKAMP